MSGGRCVAGIWRWGIPLRISPELRVRNDRLWGLIRPKTAFVHARVSPQLAGGHDRIDAGVLPPGRLVANAVDQPVMDAAERDREFVACLTPKCPRLHEPQVMGVG